MHSITDIIRSRRAFFPKMYSGKEIPKQLIEEILENANWAPTHKRTEPWRFRVFHSLESRQRLSDYILADFKANTPPELYSDVKVNDVALRPIQASCVLAIVMQREPAQSLPEWEEMAAVAMSVQNIWLSCTAHDIGAYWATPGFISRLGTILELGEGEKCLGLFYMGYLKEDAKAPALRGKIEEKVRWM